MIAGAIVLATHVSLSASRGARPAPKRPRPGE